MEMARLNHRYRGIDSPTNVISFCLEGVDADQVLGEIIISVDTARRESEAGGIGLLQRLGELLLHGLVHLIGYDHRGAGRREWTRLESELGPLLAESGFLQPTKGKS
jgi:rRNA maturation RNase YbeY